MSVFNSLGSNYNLSYALRFLFCYASGRGGVMLKNFLQQRYGGSVFLFYKGRQALTFGLENLNLPDNSRIVINGFTCVAVFNAIRKAGFDPLCLDIEKVGLNFSAKMLEQALVSNKNVRAVVIQNTFGFPCEIGEIERLCKKNNLILIEDLAHSIGARYKDGREAGTVGDMVVLSFSQDKVIDAVSGGALVIRNKKYFNQRSIQLISKNIGAVKGNKDRFYPILTYKIRFLYKFGLGKIYHFILKKFNLLSNVMDKSYYDYFSMPGVNAAMALWQFSLLDEQLRNRRKIAGVYISKLSENVFPWIKDEIDREISLSSNLRFPILVNKRAELISKLKKKGIYLADIWYTDVAPDCAKAVGVSRTILNLPTHRNVSERDAGLIVDILNSNI